MLLIKYISKLVASALVLVTIASGAVGVTAFDASTDIASASVGASLFDDFAWSVHLQSYDKEISRV